MTKEYLKYVIAMAGMSGMTLTKRDCQTLETVRTEPKVKRNEPCPCGSGLKFKKCCLNKEKI